MNTDLGMDGHRVPASEVATRHPTGFTHADSNFPGLEDMEMGSRAESSTAAPRDLCDVHDESQTIECTPHTGTSIAVLDIVH